MSHDPDQRAVYLAEDRVQRWLEQPRINLFGSTFDPEPDQVFTTLAAAKLFCTLTCAELGLPPVAVRLRKGEAKSHYEPAKATIALASWGASRLVICHELAHHWVAHRASTDTASHGVEFRSAMVQIVRHIGAPVTAQLLALAYADSVDSPELRGERPIVPKIG